jgi:hypothetical protein
MGLCKAPDIHPERYRFGILIARVRHRLAGQGNS